MFDSKAVPDSYIDSLSSALAALHSLPLNHDAEDTGFTPRTCEQVRGAMKERMEKTREQYDVSDDLWTSWQKCLNTDDMWPEKTCIVHGDLFPGHTLIDENHHVCGIIDWTEAEISDPSIDFIAVYMLFGEATLDKLIEGYKHAGGYVWPKMKEHIIERLSTQPITIAEFASSSGLEEYQKMAEDMLKSGK